MIPTTRARRAAAEPRLRTAEWRLTSLSVLSLLRRVLSYPVSVAGLIEVALWLAIPYLTIGLVWSFFHFEDVQHIQARLEQQLHLSPGSYELAALAESTALWPVILVLPSGVCAH